jgi:hypothetical protein
VSEQVRRKLKAAMQENARLMAEVERLTEAWVDKKMQEDRDALLQQVERLTKAGDLICRMAGNNEVINRHWKAAKKGD